MFCNVPVVANDVGIYKTLKGDDRWGVVINKYCAEEYIKTIEGILRKDLKLQPRQCMMDKRLSMAHCLDRWKKLLEDLVV